MNTEVSGYIDSEKVHGAAIARLAARQDHARKGSMTVRGRACIGADNHTGRALLDVQNLSNSA
jgi:hypothetical protein